MSKPTRYDRDTLAITWYVIGAVLACIAIATLTGCSTVRSAVDEYRDWRDKQKAADEKPATPETPPAKPEAPDKPESPDKPETPTTPTVPQGDNSFLWKPSSDTRGGRAAVLLPASLTASTITVNGESPQESAGRSNGNRQTFFLRKAGSAYGANVKVVAVGTTRSWIVPNGAARWASN